MSVVSPHFSKSSKKKKNVIILRSVVILFLSDIVCKPKRLLVRTPHPRFLSLWILLQLLPQRVLLITLLQNFLLEIFRLFFSNSILILILLIQSSLSLQVLPHLGILILPIAIIWLLIHLCLLQVTSFYCTNCSHFDNLTLTINSIGTV